MGKEIGCCWPVCADEGSSVASVLRRETVACGRLKREDLSAVGWKAVKICSGKEEDRLRGRRMEDDGAGLRGENRKSNQGGAGLLGLGAKLTKQGDGFGEENRGRGGCVVG